MISNASSELIIVATTTRITNSWFWIWASTRSMGYVSRVDKTTFRTCIKFISMSFGEETENQCEWLWYGSRLWPSTCLCSGAMGSSIRTSPEPCDEPSGRNFGRKIYMREDHEDEGIIFCRSRHIQAKGEWQIFLGIESVTQNLVASCFPRFVATFWGNLRNREFVNRLSYTSVLAFCASRFQGESRMK